MPLIRWPLFQNKLQPFCISFNKSKQNTQKYKPYYYSSITVDGSLLYLLFYEISSQNWYWDREIFHGQLATNLMKPLLSIMQAIILAKILPRPLRFYRFHLHIKRTVLSSYMRLLSNSTFWKSDYCITDQ